MLLLADSGSTKTEWRLVDDGGKTVTRIETGGLNPYFLSSEEITAIIRNRVLPLVTEADQVFFYGAGCGSPAKAAQVVEALAIIPARCAPEVSGDILGSARSLLQDGAGTACILGTGANSCFYDGRAITRIMPSLGYMFSDWGSGTVMCKDLIGLLLREKLPAEMIEEFHDTYGISRTEILDAIYNKPLPNRFLASFTPFLLKYSEEPLCRNIITENFRNFFDYYVLGYQERKEEVRVSFTGSIAYTFSSYLLEVAQGMGIAVDKIVQHPMDGLVEYHCVTVPSNA
jgi:glucosamine kinase